MKQYRIIEAYKMLDILSDNTNLSDLDQWNIYKLRKVLRSHFEFQQERETAIREKYMPFANEKGTLDGDKANEFLTELNDLSQLEVELEEFKKPQIRIVKGINCKIMEPLEEFIEFIEPIK